MPPSTSTSSASSGCFDLHCTEDAGELTGYRGDADADADADDSISVEGEEAVADTAGSVHFPVESVDPAARRDAVDWMLKVRACYRFRPLTAYLAVIYADRFLASHRLQQNGWALQLLSVACLSLAAKMEETLVPTLLDLQVEDAKFIFEPRTVLRMELLVLTALDWQLQTVSPFSFVDFFARKIDSSGKRARALASKATQIILAAMREIDTASHSPSALAAAAVICAINETQDLAVVNPTIAATWCIGLTEMISLCYSDNICVGDSNMLHGERRWIGQRNHETWSECVQPAQLKKSGTSYSLPTNELEDCANKIHIHWETTNTSMSNWKLFKWDLETIAFAEFS